MSNSTNVTEREGKTVLQQRIQELVDRHGGMRPAARVLEVDQGYVYRLLSGEKSDPGEKLLRKLKLRRVVTYERTDGMSDSDLDWLEDEEEEAEAVPAQYAARKVMEAIQLLAEAK